MLRSAWYKKLLVPSDEPSLTHLRLRINVLTVSNSLHAMLMPNTELPDIGERYGFVSALTNDTAKRVRREASRYSFRAGLLCIVLLGSG